MKKILLAGLLFIATFALAAESDDCTKKDFGDCTFLYTCKNNVSLLIKQEKVTGTCLKILEKTIIVDKTKSVTTITHPQQ